MASFIYSTTIILLQPPPSMPPRPIIRSRGLSSITLARGLAAACGAGLKYWFILTVASSWLRLWARMAAPREALLTVDGLLFGTFGLFGVICILSGFM